MLLHKFQAFKKDNRNTITEIRLRKYSYDYRMRLQNKINMPPIPSAQTRDKWIKNILLAPEAMDKWAMKRIPQRKALMNCGFDLHLDFMAMLLGFFAIQAMESQDQLYIF